MDNMSALGASIELEELMCQLSVWLNEVRVGDRYFPDFTTDRERMEKPYELRKNIPKVDQHPIVKQLFNWLSNSQRSADDFISVVGLLWKKCEEHFRWRQCFPMFGRVMIEALAIRNPVLANAWEHAALFVVNFYDEYEFYDNDISPNYLSDWIIHVMGDPNICHKLRIKLISLFKKLDFVNDHNWEMAIKSVMFACSSLTIENENDTFLMVSPSVITKVLEVFSNDNKMFDFDHRLCEKLQNAKTSQLSAILHDVSYAMRLNASRTIEPTEVKGLIALLNTTGRYAQLEHKTLQEGGISLLKADHIENLEEISGTLLILFSSFPKSCQMPQLISVTASCIMDVVELIIQASDPADQEMMYYRSLDNCEQSVMKLYLYGLHHLSAPRDIATSPIGREIIDNFSRRLRGIRSKLEHHEPFKNYCPAIYDLVFLNS